MNPVIFLDNKFQKSDPGLLRSLTPGVVEAPGMFETMRAYQGKVFAFEAHCRRLKQGLKRIGITAPLSDQKALAVIQKVLSANHLKEARVRYAVWRSSNKVRIAIVCQKEQGLSAQQWRKGFSATISTKVRNKTKLSHLKSINYQPFRDAFLQAKEKGFDEAILLNAKNELVEGARTNLFFVKDGVLMTPAIRCGCLNGITRSCVLKLARQLRLPVKTVRAKAPSLLKADEAFLTNSVSGLVPLRELDGRKIGGRNFAVTEKIYQEYLKLIHNNI